MPQVSQTPRQYLESVSPDLLFSKERSVLLVSEISKKLGLTDQHVLNLIEEGKLIALNVGGGSRNFWRVPMEAYEKYLVDNLSLA